jgi:hypothetical protein
MVGARHRSAPMKGRGGVTRIMVAVASVCAAVGLLAATMFASQGTSSAQSVAAQRLIVSPRAGELLRGPSIVIRVRTGRDARRFAARLNGKAVGRDFSIPSRSGVRRLRASARDGLRDGRNRLYVWVRGNGGAARSRTISFRVAPRQPAVAARVAVAVGDRVVLNGRRLGRRLEGACRGAGSSPRDSWKILSGPGADARGQRLAGADTVRPRFVAKTAGTYVVRLTVRACSGTTGSVLIDVRADPAPAAAVDTMASGADGATGIRVGKEFYAAQPGTWAQLVTLDRETLEPVTGTLANLANKSYPCPDLAHAEKCVTTLEQDLDKLGSHDLVIVANPVSTAKAKGTPGLGLESALGPIGVLPTSFTKSPTGLLPGSISAIGLPGLQAGKANWHAVAAPKQEGEGRMRDYLIRNNEGDYVFAPSDRIPFNTQAPGSNANTNVIQIGDERFSQNITRGWGGFQIVVVNRQTLKGTTEWFRTNAGVPLTRPHTLTMWQTLAQANTGDKLVFIASRGNPYVSGQFGGSEQAAINRELQHIADQIESLGGTRTGIFHALDPGLSHHDSYTLVGSSNLGPGNGQESLRANTPDQGINPSLSVTPMTGTLARTGPNYSFQVQTTPTVGASTSDKGADPSAAAAELNQVVVQPPSAWPEQGNPGRTAAIAWIGLQVFGTDDPRAQYWTVIYKPTVWEDYATRIGKLTYAGGNDFSAADLDWAKAELQREIGWLENVHSYLENLSEPFSKTQLQNWAAFEQISNTIRDQVGVGADQKTTAAGQALWAGFRQILAAIPEAGHAFHAADAIYETVMKFVEIAHEPAEDEFQTKASELGVALADRLTATQDMLTRQIPNTIAADYAKLKTVGSCTSTDPKDWPACPFDHADWQFTQDDQANAAKALVPGMKIWAYGSLLNARYNLYRLPQWWRTKVGGKDSEFYGLPAFVSPLYYPFDGLPASAQYAKPIYRNLPTYGHTITRDPASGEYSYSGDTWQIYALGYLTGSGVITDRWLMHYPKAEVTDPIFKPVDHGGLGADPESFFDRYFPHMSTLDHYPEKDTKTGWCVTIRRNNNEPCE